MSSDISSPESLALHSSHEGGEAGQVMQTRDNVVNIAVWRAQRAINTPAAVDESQPEIPSDMEQAA